MLAQQIQTKITVYGELDSSHCKTTLDKVEFCYLHYQDAVNDDHNLMLRYQEHFFIMPYDIKEMNHISRIGRKLREIERKQFKPRFLREENFQRLSKAKEEEMRERFKNW